jgi:hypothetical protein
VTTRLVGDELDLDLASLATSLLIVVVVIVGCHRVSWSLDAARVVAVEVIARRRVVETGGGIGDVSHCVADIEDRGTYYAAGLPNGVSVWWMGSGEVVKWEEAHLGLLLSREVLRF